MISIFVTPISQHGEETKLDCFSHKGEKICMIDRIDLCDLLSDKEYQKFEFKPNTILFVDENQLYKRAKTIYSSL